jgi:catechol 2,3-dioxygenase-like lactoylglutathione lyase family enzyme
MDTMDKAKVDTLRSVDITVVDAETCLAFFTSVWNLRPVAECGGVHYLRGTGPHHHILSLRESGRPALVRVVFGTRNRRCVEALHARAAEAGLTVSAPKELDWPGGGYGFGLRDPEGRNYAVVCDVADHAMLAAEHDCPTKLSHVNLNTGVHEASAEVLDLLGFRTSDVTLKLRFFRCSSDHHSIVLGFTGGPTLNHLAFEMPDLDSLMRGIGRMRDHGYPVEWGPGRHGPGNNAFAYFAGPEELPLEYTCEMDQVDETYQVSPPDAWKWPPGRLDHWGLTPGPSARMLRVQELVRFTPDGYLL